MLNFINKINSILTKCTKCDSYNVRGGPYIKYYDKPVDIVFVAQNPGKGNCDKDLLPDQIIPFGVNVKNNYNTFFYLLIPTLSSLAKRDINFYITNVIKCATKDNLVPDDMIKNCLPLLEIELKFIKYRCLISLGKVAKNALITLNKNFIDVYHPGYLNRRGPLAIKTAVDNLIKKILETNNAFI